MNSASTTPENIRVLYVVYWGLCEPLGASLVLPSLLGLASLGTRLTVVSFEKPEDFRNRAQVTRVRGLLAGSGIRWAPLLYHKTPKWPATVLDLIQGWARAVVAQLQERYDLVHGRTFVGGLTGLMIAKTLGARFVYHAEGFYPDEQVDGGVWTEGAAPHRVARWVDQMLYRSADGAVVLSERARVAVQECKLCVRKTTPIIVVRSCIDLSQFRCNRAVQRLDSLRLIYCGSIGRRYMFEEIARFVAAVRGLYPMVSLTVLTHNAQQAARSILERQGLPSECWRVNCVPYSEIPSNMENHHAGLFFLRRGISEHGCSPTKVAEYWASGLPVVTTANVSDNDELINRHQVGVILRDHSESSYANAAHELMELLRDPRIAERCRRVALSNFCVRAACETQFRLYQNILPSTVQHGNICVQA